MEEGIVTFFFRNFPDYCSAEDLRRKFEVVGKVKEVFIPAKRDKAGNRFGFVRFCREGKEGEILVKLNKVWIDSYIIRAFLPRYERVRKSLGRRASCEGERGGDKESGGPVKRKWRSGAREKLCRGS